LDIVSPCVLDKWRTRLLAELLKLAIVYMVVPPQLPGSGDCKVIGTTKNVAERTAEITPDN
jgi:hypothetical protein